MNRLKAVQLVGVSGSATLVLSLGKHWKERMVFKITLQNAVLIFVCLRTCRGPGLGIKGS